MKPTTCGRVKKGDRAYIPVGDRTLLIEVTDVYYYNRKHTVLLGPVTDVGPLGRGSVGARVTTSGIEAGSDHPALVDA